MDASRIQQEIDRLYALPLAEFIAARNALAKTLRAGGDRQAADEVKALAKPSVTAWAVNALYHHDRERFDDLFEATAAVRAALAGKGDRRKADAARRKALKALLRRAAEILVEAGHAATPANRQRMSHTLEALAAREPATGEPRFGRLTVDLEPQGFEVLADLAASLAPARPAATPKPEPAERSARKIAAADAAAARDTRLAAAQQKVSDLEASLADLEREAEQAEAVAGKATERHRQLTEEAAEAERRARAAADAAAAAKQDMSVARVAATKARTARRRGRSRLETARRQLERQQS